MIAANGTGREGKGKGREGKGKMGREENEKRERTKGTEMKQRNRYGGK
jgi:hypothetical protein